MEKHLNKAPVVLSSAEQPGIYVVCLASYCDGKVYGEWINATQSTKDILDQIALMQYRGYYSDGAMLSEDYCPHPDTYAIHCHRGFYDVEIYVNAKIEDVRAYALSIAQYGELGAQLISLSFGNLAEAKRFVDEGYLGSYKNRSAFDCNEDYLAQIPEYLRFCVKYESEEVFVMKRAFPVDAGGKRHIFRDLEKPKFNTRGT